MNFLREGILVSLLAGILPTCNASYEPIDFPSLVHRFNNNIISMIDGNKINPRPFINQAQRNNLAIDHPEVRDNFVTLENGELCWCGTPCTRIPQCDRERIKSLIDNGYTVKIVFQEVCEISFGKEEPGFCLKWEISESTTNDNTSRKTTRLARN